MVNMEWFIKQAVVCSKTGTAFAIASNLRNLNLILWYRGDYFLQKGNTLSVTSFGLIVNGKTRNLQLLHVFSFSHSLWVSLTQNLDCPGNTYPMIRHCPKRPGCLFKHCPYGAMLPHQ
ncbi:anti-adapter protein iraM [Enterobacter sp.]|uniref:anti-adapter protein iraM n=1 Tax=Enterobacter sp. TaxID=42895 RepID=UPI00296FD3F6|nr:anti-adapter protein iraM [Enterobacter sp.]